MTLGVNSLPANELSQTLWVDLFPWLDDYVSDRAALLEPLAPSPDWWFSEAPSFTVLEVDLEKVLRAGVPLHRSPRGSGIKSELSATW